MSTTKTAIFNVMFNISAILRVGKLIPFKSALETSAGNPVSIELFRAHAVDFGRAYRACTASSQCFGFQNGFEYGAIEMVTKRVGRRRQNYYLGDFLTRAHDAICKRVIYSFIPLSRLRFVPRMCVKD